MAEVGFGSVFATLGNQLGRLGFEQRFSTLQNTVIGRLNDEIQKVNESGSADAPETRALQRKFSQLGETRPVLRQYIFDNQSNGLKLIDAATLISSAQASLSSDDGDATVITAAEVTDFEAKRDATITQLERLIQLSNPSITDGNSIQYLKAEINTLKELTVTAGVVDAEGTDTGSLTNQNRTTLDYLGTILEKVNNAKDQTVSTIRSANQFQIRAQRQLADIEVRFTELTTLEQAQKAAEVEQLQQQYATLLDSISLSYEVRSGLNDSLVAALQPQVIPSGSILNIFT